MGLFPTFSAIWRFYFSTRRPESYVHYSSAEAVLSLCQSGRFSWMLTISFNRISLGKLNGKVENNRD